jgi:hypothetical protein
MSRYLFFPRNLCNLLVVPYQSGIYCLPTFPTRIEKTINVPYQSGIYCPQDIVRS